MTNEKRFTIYANAIDYIKDLIMLGQKELTNSKMKKMHIYNLSRDLMPIRKEKVVITSYLKTDSHIYIETLKNGTYYYNGEQINSQNMNDYFVYNFWSIYSPKKDMKVQLIVDKYFFDIKEVLNCVIEQVESDIDYQEWVIERQTKKFIEEMNERKNKLKILKDCLL